MSSSEMTSLLFNHPYLVRIVIDWDDGSGLRVDATFASDFQSSHGEQVRLSCTGVPEIKFDFTPGHSIFLQIEDIRDRGWEGLPYRVSDTEQSGLSFYCASASMAVLHRDS